MVKHSRVLFLLISCCLPLVHIMLFPPARLGEHDGLKEYAMGFPFHFVLYRDFEEFTKIKIITEFKKTQVDLMYYILSVIVLYFVLVFILRIYKHAINKFMTSKNKL